MKKMIVRVEKMERGKWIPLNKAYIGNTMIKMVFDKKDLDFEWMDMYRDDLYCIFGVKGFPKNCHSDTVSESSTGERKSFLTLEQFFDGYYHKDGKYEKYWSSSLENRIVDTLEMLKAVSRNLKETRLVFWIQKI